MESRVSVLFVCLGNICRSPLAEGIMRDIVKRRGIGWMRVDSCGTSSYHVGESPHSGSLRVARERGVSLEGQRSRQLDDRDFERFDWLVAMDTSNLRRLQHLAPRGFDPEHVVLLLDYARGDGPRDVPDPYYEGGFPGVFDRITDGCEGLLEQILAEQS